MCISTQHFSFFYKNYLKRKKRKENSSFLWFWSVKSLWWVLQLWRAAFMNSLLYGRKGDICKQIYFFFNSLVVADGCLLSYFFITFKVLGDNLHGIQDFRFGWGFVLVFVFNYVLIFYLFFLSALNKTFIHSIFPGFYKA